MCKVKAAAPTVSSDKVTVKKVHFKNRININIAGHPFGGVKEQTADFYSVKNYD